MSKEDDQVDGGVTDSCKASPSSGVKYRIVCCQRCHQMLDVETNLHQLEEAIQAELSAESLKKPDIATILKDSSVLDNESAGPSSIYDIRNRLRIAAMENLDEENMTLGHQKIVFTSEEEDERSEKLKLMDLLSDVSTVDHPVCTSCTDSIMEELELEISSIEKECVSYEYFLRQFKKNPSENAVGDSQVDCQGLEDQLRELQLEETGLKQAIRDAEAERVRLISQVNELKQEGELIKVAEDDYYAERAKYDREISELEDEQESVNYQMRVAEMMLDKLKKTNVFNLAFHIWHQDQFGTINGFRLGRLPGSPVEWPEINAAWGQTVLLLYSLAKKINFTFKKYRLVPFGSHSYIECLDDQNKKLPLYGDGGFKFFWDSKFDHAMAAFLECLHQFKEQVERSDSGFCLPYDIESSLARIKDVHSGASYCIRAQFNSVEQWTKALKWMLTNLKWGLAWVVSQFGDYSE